jgi:UDP-glucose 4-epimerase
MRLTTQHLSTPEDHRRTIVATVGPSPNRVPGVRAVVTGGAGFIGANLCARLAAAGHEVRALDDLSTGFAANLEGVPAELVEGTILDGDLLAEVCRDADAIVHLAARASVPRSVADPVASHDANATGTVRVLEAARACRADGSFPLVVVASSSSVYGSNPALPKHEGLATRPLSPYAASKLATESYALAYQSSYGVPVLAFRFFNVFGPLQSADHVYAAVIPTFVAAALAGRPLVVHGDGKQSRDFTFVDTVTEVITDAVQRRVAHDEPVNLAFGTRTNLLDVISMIEAELGAPVTVEHVEPRVGDVRHSQADSSRLAGLFPGVTAVGLGDGLARTIAWFRSQGG